MANNDSADEARTDMVNNPSHYSPNGVDSFMHTKDQMGKDAFDGFLQGNVMKYTQRYRFKGKPVEDLCKAAFYLFHLALEAETDTAKRKAVVSKLGETLVHAAHHFGLSLQDFGVSLSDGGAR